MWKSIFSGLFVVALLVAISFGAQKSLKNDDELRNLSLINVEALAQNESGNGTKCYKSITTKEGSQILYCGTCHYVPGTNTFWSGTGTCP